MVTFGSKYLSGARKIGQKLNQNGRNLASKWTGQLHTIGNQAHKRSQEATDDVSRAIYASAGRHAHNGSRVAQVAHDTLEHLDNNRVIPAAEHVQSHLGKIQFH